MMQDPQSAAMGMYKANSQQSPFLDQAQPGPGASPMGSPPVAAQNSAMLGALGGGTGQPPPVAGLGWDPQLGNNAVQDLQQRKLQAQLAPPTNGSMGQMGQPMNPPLGAPAQGGPPQGNPMAGTGTFPQMGRPNIVPMGGPATGGPPTAGPQGQPPFGNLTDPTTWMNLVHNPQQLGSWVQQGLGRAGGNQQLDDYYVGKIQGQPGANPTEQQGSAAYWMDKLHNDPNVTGRPQAAPGGGMSMPPQLMALLAQAQGQQQQAGPMGPSAAPSYSDQMRQALMQQIAMQGALGGNGNG